MLVGAVVVVGGSDCDGGWVVALQLAKRERERALLVGVVVTYGG